MNAQAKFRSFALPLALLLAAIALPLVVPTYYVQFASQGDADGHAGDGAQSRRRLRRPGQPVPCGLLRPRRLRAGAGVAREFRRVALAVAADRHDRLRSLRRAAVIGALSLRTRGIYFIMVTLAFGEMLFYLFHDTKIGGGSDGTLHLLQAGGRIAGSYAARPRQATVFYYRRARLPRRRRRCC